MQQYFSKELYLGRYYEVLYLRVYLGNMYLTRLQLCMI